jgi:hypothetical protein
MAIVDTKIVIRPNTSVPFYIDSGSPIRQAAYDAFEPLRASGKYSSVYTVSGDGLTQTAVITCADLETYSAYETILGIEFDCDYITYLEDNNFPMLNKNTNPRPFTTTGIDSPFTCTTVYTFRENDPTMSIFASSVGLDSTLNVTVGSNTVTVVKEYANSADFTDNAYVDLRYTQQLKTKGVTRTITYAYVS